MVAYCIDVVTVLADGLGSVLDLKDDRHAAEAGVPGLGVQLIRFAGPRLPQ